MRHSSRTHPTGRWVTDDGRIDPTEDGHHLPNVRHPMTYGHYITIVYLTATIGAVAYALWGEQIRDIIRRWR